MSDTPLTAPVQRQGSCLAKAFLILGVLALVFGGLWWWHNRPIQPVSLSQDEKLMVEAKVEAMQKAPQEPEYLPGSREIAFTERELNGLLNQNTQLGESLRFEFATDSIHARFETDLDPGLPLIGGRNLKLRARLRVADADGRAALILDDLTVWGVSLPNEWLGGLKGRDLLGEALGTKGNIIAGIEELSVEPGKLRILLAE